MAVLRKRSRSGILAVVSLAVLVLAGMTIRLSAHPAKAAPQPGSSPATYLLSCSQITVGAGYGTGGAYRMKDVLKIASPSEHRQGSASYTILDTLVEENAGSPMSPAGVVIWREY
jgi:hypothetical protein